MKIKSLILGLMTLALFSATPLHKSAEASSESTIAVSKDNLLVVNDEISPETMGAVILKAKELDKKLSGTFGNKSKPIYLFVNSPGGSIQTGLELIEALKGLGRPVHTITLFSASMAFQLVQNLDDRYILKNGVLMSHRAMGAFQGSFGGQSPSQIDSRYGLWMNRLTELDQQTVKRTKGKQTLESYRKAYADELWLTGNQSVEQGYADKVVSLQCDKSLSGTDKHSLALFGGLIKVEYETDECPINTNPLNIKIAIETNKGKKYLNQFQAEGGSFEKNCMQIAATNKDTLCAADPSLDLQKIKDAEAKFKEQFTTNKNHALPMYW